MKKLYRIAMALSLWIATTAFGYAQSYKFDFHDDPPQPICLAYFGSGGELGWSTQEQVRLCELLRQNGYAKEERTRAEAAFMDFLWSLEKSDLSIPNKDKLAGGVVASFKPEDCLYVSTCRALLDRLQNMAGTPNKTMQTAVVDALGFIASWNRVRATEDLRTVAPGAVYADYDSLIVAYPRGDFAMAKMALEKLKEMHNNHPPSLLPTLSEEARDKIHSVLSGIGDTEKRVHSITATAQGIQRELTDH